MTKAEGMLVGISEKLISVLPPAMLVLVLLNIVFLAVQSYLFSYNVTARNDMLSRIIDTCLKERT